MSELPSGDLLREVARTQHDKTLQMVRDALEVVPVTQPKKYDNPFGSRHEERPARDYRADVIARLQKIRDDAR